MPEPSRPRRSATLGPTPESVSTGASGSTLRPGPTAFGTTPAKPASAGRRVLAGRARTPPRLGRGPDGMALEKGEHPLPGILGGLRELVLPTVEEAVGRTVVRRDLVLDAGRRQGVVEGIVDLRRDVL